MSFVLKHRVLYNVEKDNQPQQKQWYETIWGLVLITIGLNVFSNYLYDRGRDSILGTKSREVKEHGKSFSNISTVKNNIG